MSILNDGAALNKDGSWKHGQTRTYTKKNEIIYRKMDGTIE